MKSLKFILPVFLLLIVLIGGGVWYFVDESDVSVEEVVTVEEDDEENDSEIEAEDTEEPESVEESPPDSTATVHNDFDYISDSLTKYLIWWGEEVAMVENCSGGYYEGYGPGSGVYFCEDTENRWLQFEWLDGTEVRVPGDAGENFLGDYRSSGGSTFQWTMTDDEKYWIYLNVWSSDEYQLISYDVAAAKEEVLMSFLAMDYDYGCSGTRFFGWNPDHTKLGIIVNNETEDVAYPTNTKVFILTIEDGKLTNKSKYDLRVLPDCTPNNGPFFAVDWVDNDTIGYYDPSDYSDSEYLETLFWSDDPWGSEYARFYDVK